MSIAQVLKMHFSEMKGQSGCTVSIDSLSREGEQEESEGDSDDVVSFHAELPLPLQSAMTRFIERYPNWDQYRLIQAALAGYLVQNGVDSRSITRLYLGKMFGPKILQNGA